MHSKQHGIKNFTGAWAEKFMGDFGSARLATLPVCMLLVWRVSEKFSLT